MILQAIVCHHCKDTIYSRATHDHRSCSCGKCSIDGGFEYTRVITESFDNITETTLDMDVTKPELYDDWNKNINKYGLIKGKK